jgi:DNA-binding HxlR family transcriptional regulator
MEAHNHKCYFNPYHSFWSVGFHIPLISRKVLTEQLKELEEDGLLERFAYKELPPRVEYKLSEKGLAFLPILESIKEWNLQI